MKKHIVLILIFVFAVFSISCGSKKGEKASEENIKKKEVSQEVKKAEEKKDTVKEDNPMAAFQKFAENMKKASEEQQGGKIVVLGEKDFIKILPEVSGWKLDGKPYYEKSKFGAFENSYLTVDYIKGDKSVKFKITDTGTASSMLSFLKMAISMNIENETSDGYEKVVEVKGYKGVEKFNKNDNTGEIMLLVNNRFIVEVSGGEGVGIDTLKEFLEKAKLSELKQ